jgi:hypothetical protein
MNFKSFKTILIENNILDIKPPVWEKHSIFHGGGCLVSYNKKTHLEVAKDFIAKRNSAGIYAYFKDSECLYIGKAKCLQSRIHVHLLESESIWGAKKWQDFFSKNCGHLDLYLFLLPDKGVEEEYLRQIIEILLTEEYKPSFISCERRLN